MSDFAQSIVWCPETVVEFAVFQLDNIPRCLCSFESTASLIAERILPANVSHFCYKLPVSKMRKYKRERELISEKYSQLFDGVYINAD